MGVGGGGRSACGPTLLRLAYGTPLITTPLATLLPTTCQRASWARSAPTPHLTPPLTSYTRLGIMGFVSASKVPGSVPALDGIIPPYAGEPMAF